MRRLNRAINARLRRVRAPFTVCPVRFAVLRHEPASTGNFALGRVKARRGPAARRAALMANPAAAKYVTARHSDVLAQADLEGLAAPLHLKRGCDRFGPMSRIHVVSVEQP